MQEFSVGSTISTHAVYRNPEKGNSTFFFSEVLSEDRLLTLRHVGDQVFKESIQLSVNKKKTE